MKINSINNNQTFRRAVVIRTNKENSTNEPVSMQIREICKVINKEKSEIYTKKESNKIRNFFYDVLGDFDINNPAIVEKSVNGDTVLLTGKEAEQIKDLKSKIQRHTQKLANDKRYTQEARDDYYQNAMFAVKKAVQYREENGKAGKPESSIKIENYTGRKKGFKTKVSYSSYMSQFLPLKDGHSDKTREEREFPYVGGNCKHIIYDFKELIF